MLSSTIFRTHDFNPDNSEDYNPKTIENKFTLRGPIENVFNKPVNYNYSSEYSQTEQDERILNTTLGLNTRIGRFSVGESLSYNQSEVKNEKTESIKGSSTVRTTLEKINLRGNIDYKISPVFEWQKILLNAEGRVDHDKSLRGELSHDIDPQKTKLAISANWYHDKFTLTPLVSYDSNQEIQATVNLGLSSIYDTTDNKIKIIPNNGSGKGIARAFVYFDKNGNNIFDGTDEALPDVRVMTVQTFRSALTDENGVALISNIPEYTATDITVDTSTLSDLYYILGRPGNSVYARPGKVTKIEFPVHLSGELDGRVNIESSDRLRTEKSINGLQVQLINERGEVEMSTVTAFDGYFVFSTVPPGKYLVSINSDDLKKISLRQPLPQYIEVGYEGKVISGQDIKLTPGTEIPITVYKDKNTDPINATDFIALDFGSYRSELLAQLIRFKMAHSLRRNDIRLNIDVLAVKDDHDKNYRLETMIINDNLSRAQEICGIAAESNIACSVKVPTKLLFDHLSHNKAPSGLSFDTKPATVL